MADKSFLNIDEVNSLLPQNMKIDTQKFVERNIYRTVENKYLPVLNSKMYLDYRCWYSSVTKYYKELGAEYICLTAGIIGIFVVPIDIILEYNKTSGWKGESRKGRQYHIRIEGLVMRNYNELSQNIDLTSYFYPNGEIGQVYLTKYSHPRINSLTPRTGIKKSSKKSKVDIDDDDEEYDFDFDF